MKTFLIKNIIIILLGTFICSATAFAVTRTIQGTYIFPTADGTNLQVLKTNGAGTLSWAADNTGTGLGTTTSGYLAGLEVTSTTIDTIIVRNATTTELAITGTVCSAGDFLTNSGDDSSLLCDTPAGGGSGTVGSGLKGQLPYYAADGTTLTATSSIIITTAQRVGIGTSTPNSIFGVNELIDFRNADWKTLIGYQAGKYDLGQYNTYIGYLAGSTNNATNKTNAADENTGIGYQTLYANTTGNTNSAVGSQALLNNTTGYSNTAMGNYALRTSNTGYYNTAMGVGALYANTSGNNNSAMGRNALFANSTGNNNIGLGYYAGKYETGSNSFYVNNQDRTDTAGDKSKSLLYGTMAALAADQTLIINAGKVGIGTSTPVMMFSVQGDALANSWNVNSDIYKGDALTKLKNIKAEIGKTGDWVSVDHNSLPEGILKNNLVEYDKEIPATKDTATTTQHISYNVPTMSISGLAQMNTRAIQQLMDENLQQQAEIEALKARINKIDGLGSEEISLGKTEKQGFNWGWLGLLGLLSFYPLIKRK